MDWATVIFPLETRREPSDFIERIWRTRGVPDAAMISVAEPHWQVVVVEHAHAPTRVVLRGPETAASIVDIPQDASFFGIEFKLGVFMPDMATSALVDIGHLLQTASRTEIHLAGARREIPTFETAGDFVRRLARDEVLARDPVVEQTLLRRPVAITERSVQRRFLRATGLTYATIRQIDRAARAADLLARGVPILDTTEIAGYSDQAHMTRSLQRFLGKTPGRVART